MIKICAFCKTPFRIAKSGAGKCPVCGHRTGAVRPAAGLGPSAKLWLAVALMLAAALFAIVAFSVFGKNQKKELLTISVVSVANAESGYSIKSVIRNFSDSTYSVPDIVFVIKSKSGEILGQVAQLPPDGLIDPMSELSFTRIVEPAVPGGATISARFVEEE
ncbi:MAG: hypothetical protein LBL46_03450 [Rickettsiales bacterium]|jgi:hypothetical protein|nr:hypothetical protein [Rickettsiales bacterium]